MTIRMGVELQIGDVIADKYVLERLIGQGGMGAVFAARHIELGALRAIKILNADQLGCHAGLERFLQEARIASRLESDHVTRVYDIGRLNDGRPYIVMEYLEGNDLARVVRSHGALSVKEAVLCVLQACGAVAEAHRLGIIHRDLKPANLFLTKRPNGMPCVKVLDFGIAKVWDPYGSNAEMTRAGELIGSPAYMAPEQMLGAPADQRTDVWALGAVLYKLLTGSHPFLVRDLRTGKWSSREDPFSSGAIRSDLPPGLEAVIRWCLEKDPAHRIQSAGAMQIALASFAPRMQTIELELAPTVSDWSTTVCLEPRARGISGEAAPNATTTGMEIAGASATWAGKAGAASSTIARYGALFIGAAISAVALVAGGASLLQQTSLASASTGARPIESAPLVTSASAAPPEPPFAPTQPAVGSIPGREAEPAKDPSPRNGPSASPTASGQRPVGGKPANAGVTPVKASGVFDDPYGDQPKLPKAADQATPYD